MKQCPNFECLEFQAESCVTYPGCDGCSYVDKCEVCRNQTSVIAGAPLRCDLIPLPIPCRFCEIRNSDALDVGDCHFCSKLSSLA